MLSDAGSLATGRAVCWAVATMLIDHKLKTIAKSFRMLIDFRGCN